MVRFLIEYDDGTILPQALVAARRHSFVFIEQGWNNPIWGIMIEIDEFIIRLDDYVERGVPWVWQSTTIFREDITEVFVTSDTLRQINEQLDREREDSERQSNLHAMLDDMRERGIFSRTPSPSPPFGCRRRFSRR